MALINGATLVILVGLIIGCVIDGYSWRTGLAVWLGVGPVFWLLGWAVYAAIKMRRNDPPRFRW